MRSIIKKSLLGIDIGSDSIKAVRLKGLKQNEISLITKQKLGCESHDHVLFDALFERGLRAMIKDLSLSHSPCVTTLHDPSVSFVNVILPPIPTDELFNAVKFEAKKELTYPISEAVMDYFVRDKPTTESPSYALTAVSAKRAAVLKHLDQLKEAGLKPVAVEIEAIPLLAAFDHNHAWEPGKKTALLDIGTSKSHLLIVKDKTIRFYRDIPVSGSNFTGFFQETYDLPYLEASEKKIDMIGREVGVQKSLYNVENSRRLTSLFEELAVELQRSFDYYQAKYREGPINELILSGGGALIIDIDKWLNDILNIDVTIDNPFKKLYFANKKDEEKYTKLAPIFTVAVGLALRKN